MARVTSRGVEYILSAQKAVVYGNIDVTWLSFKISRKAAKKLKGNKEEDDTRAFGLVGDTPVSSLRAIERMVAGYLSGLQGVKVAVAPYSDAVEKRGRVYEAAFARLGWSRVQERNRDMVYSWDHVMVFEKLAE